MIKYEKIIIAENEIIKRDNLDGTISWIPINESNSDYQAYLRWLENPNAENGTIS